jgi:hypothetical protein
MSKPVLHHLAGGQGGGVPRLLAFLAFLLLLPLGSASAATLQERFAEANQHYWDGAYEEAQAIYHTLVATYRLENPELYYNLANSYAKTDRLGAAVLYYRRALASAPDPDMRQAAQHNLDRTRALLVQRHQQRLEQGQTLFAESHGVFYAVFHLISEAALCVAAAVLFAALVIVLLLRHGKRGGLGRATKPVAVTLLCSWLVVAGLLAGNVATGETVRLGIVIHPNTALSAARLPNAPSVALPEGLEVAITSEPGDGFVRVRLANGREGFVALESVMEI